MARRKKNHGLLVFLCILLIIMSVLTIGLVAIAINSDLLSSFVNPFEALGNGTSQQTTQSPKNGNSFAKQEETLLGETDRADDSYLDSILFLGDSRTVAMAVHGYITEDQTMAINGISHSTALTESFYNEKDKKSYTIKQEVSARKPEYIMISFGINGVGFMQEADFTDDYQKMISLVQQASPDSTVIIQSILPVAKSQETENSKLTNKAIDSCNEKLLALAEENGVYFLDTSDCLKGSDGKLDAKYDSGDGLHFNAKAYQVLFDYIRTHRAP